MFSFLSLIVLFLFSWETDDEGDFYTEQTNGRSSDQEDEDNLFRLGLSRHLIECYPMSTAEELSVVGVVCDICLNEYKAHDKVRTIPCLHKFHTRCIDKWLKVCHLFEIYRLISSCNLLVEKFQMSHVS